MAMRLSMRVHSTHSEGTGLGVTPLEYTVLGLPPDQSAQIRDFMGGSGWRMLRIKHGSGRWEGHYTTAEDALEALQERVDTGN
jgi:hypothetical protein